MFVKDIDYQDEYIVVQNSINVLELSKEIAKSGIPDAIIVDENEKVLGATDTYDIISKCLAVDKDPKLTSVEEIMYAPPPVKLESELNEVHEIMQKLEATILPVVSEDSKLIGVVTIMDVLEGLSKDQQKRGFLAKIFG